MSSRKKIIFPAPDAFVFLSSQNRRCGAAPPATHILIEKAVACRALRHRPAAETTLPLPCPHRISPPSARPTAFRSGPTRSPRSCSPAVAPMSCSPPSLPDGPAAARPAFGACRYPIVTIAHPLLIRKPVRRFWRQTKKRGQKQGGTNVPGRQKQGGQKQGGMNVPGGQKQDGQKQGGTDVSDRKKQGGAYVCRLRPVIM